MNQCPEDVPSSLCLSPELSSSWLTCSTLMITMSMAHKSTQMSSHTDDCHACPNPLDHIAQELRKTVTTTQEVLEFVPDAQDVAKFVPDALEVAKLIAAAPEVAKLIAAALEVAEVVPAAPEVNEVIPAVQEVAQTDVLIIKALATNPSDEGGLWIQVLILVPLSIYQPKKANNNKSMN